MTDVEYLRKMMNFKTTFLVKIRGHKMMVKCGDLWAWSPIPVKEWRLLQLKRLGIY
jgi:hypothetical protein